MTLEMKLTAKLYEGILNDLRRPHEFAAERVGFCQVRQTQTNKGALLLVVGYWPVADEHYIPNPSIGARIGEQAITAAVHLAYQGRQTSTGVFHVHLHDHKGLPAMSRVDRSSIPQIVDGLQQTNANAPHGFIIFSTNHAFACATTAQSKIILDEVNLISVIGPSLLTFRKSKHHD